MSDQTKSKFDSARIATVEMLVRSGEWSGPEQFVPPHLRAVELASKFGSELPDSATDAPAVLG